jgi:hypothetical protein
MARIPLALAALLIAALMSTAHGASVIYTATLNGASESPPTGSPGAGLATVTYDDVAHTLMVSATFAALTGMTTMAHIHCCTSEPFGTTNVGVAVTPNTLPNFPLGVTFGVYGPELLDLTNTATYTSGFVTDSGGTAAGAEAALIAGMNDNRAYFNIHTSTFGAGEIRGFLAPVPVPAALWLLATAFGLAAPFMRRARR